MKIRNSLRMLVAVCTFAAAVQVRATPTLLVNGGGVLIGANNVSVQGMLYNVRFKDGSCDALFNGCDASTFTFKTGNDAAAAARALLEQVFVDGPAGNFDSIPSKTFGCQSDVECDTHIPYLTWQGPDYLDVTSIYAWNTQGKEEQNVGMSVDPSFWDFSPMDFQNYATFEFVGPAPVDVPEPSSLALIGLAAAGINFTVRRRKTKN